MTNTFFEGSDIFDLKEHFCQSYCKPPKMPGNYKAPVDDVSSQQFVVDAESGEEASVDLALGEDIFGGPSSGTDAPLAGFVSLAAATSWTDITVSEFLPFCSRIFLGFLPFPLRIWN